MSRLSLTLLIFTFSLIITPVFSGCGPCKNGSCHVGICECRFSWVGDACDEYIFAGISSTYDFFRFFFLALGIIFLAITFTVTIHALKGKAAYYHLIGFILISFDCVVQIAVYGSGVETIEGDWAPYVASFITVLHFGLIYFIYSVYLLWWVEMNDKYKRMEFSMAKRTRTLGTKTSSNSNNSVTIHSNVSAASSGSNSASNDTSTYSTGVQEDTGPTSTATITISPDNNKTNPYLDNVSKEQLNSSTASIGSDAALDPSPPDLEAGKAGEEKRTKNNHSNGEKEQKEAFWYKILPKQISGRTLKWVLWSSCVLVNACNVLRVAIYDVDMTFYVTVILYVVVSVMGWIFILVSFHLYKRSFEKKLQISRKSKNEIYAGLKKITRITLVITIILLVFGLISTIQTTFESVALRMTAYTLRGLVTYTTIALYIFCFGGHATLQVWKVIVGKIKLVFPLASK